MASSLCLAKVTPQCGTRTRQVTVPSITSEIGLLFHALTPQINTLAPDRWIWNKAGNEKVRLFIWLILNKGIPTNEKCFSHNISSSPSCARWSHHLENTLHFLKDCPHSLEVWLRLGIGDDMFFHSIDVYAWLQTNLRGAHGTFFVAALWWIWRWRNNQFLDSNKWSLHFVLRSIDAGHDDFLRYLGPQGGSGHDAFRKPCWSPPPVGLIKLNVDGNFFPDSLIMGIGGLFRGSNNNWIVGFYGTVGLGDSLGAKFQAVFHGILMVWEKGFKGLIVESNSLDVIKTLQIGLLDYSARCSEVLSNIRNLLRRDWNVMLLHIPQAANKPADWLEKFGVRAVSSFSLLEEPPPEMASMLLLDELESS
ncbi:Ribonuclease H-like superfamily [Sesbania bispinosa]|nr:Ribonuclease H-like superfamily [Sesbania bispinosa]